MVAGVGAFCACSILSNSIILNGMSLLLAALTNEARTFICVNGQ